MMKEKERPKMTKILIMKSKKMNITNQSEQEKTRAAIIDLWPNEEKLPQDDRIDEEGDDEEETSEYEYKLDTTGQFDNADFEGFVFSQAGVVCNLQ